MPRRAREHDLVAEERLEHDTAMPARRADDAELELASRDLLDDPLRVGDRQGDLHGGVPLLELAEEHGEHGSAGPTRRADLEPPAELALRLVAELGEHLLLEREQPLRTAVEPMPRLGRLDTAAGAVEQLHAEPLLERADLKAHRRLRHAELLRGLREAAPLDDRTERRELAGVHKRSLCPQACAEGASSISRVAETSTRIEDTLVHGYAQLALDTPARPRVDAVLRLLDIVLSALFLVVALPVALVIAVAVVATSGRPVLYRGERVGRGGHVFTMLKFRTLNADAETRLGPYLGEELVARTNAEFTSMGRWLKATQLDEIPQFANVLRGDMSLVGPRPIRPRFFEELARELPAYWQRLVVRPGLTGFAQVRRGYETSMAEKLAHDLEWIADRSVGLYLRTVAATGWRVIKQSARGIVRPDG